MKKGTKAKRLLLISLFTIGSLMAYQNCSKVQFAELPEMDAPIGKEGDSNGGGGGDTGDTGDNTPTYVPYAYSEDVDMTENNLIDVLLVIDNSGSMTEEIARLERAFPNLINKLKYAQDANGSSSIDSGLDWRICATSTSMKPGATAANGQLFNLTPGDGTKSYIDNSDAEAEVIFQSFLASVTSNGSGEERGLANLVKVLANSDNYAEAGSCLRRDSQLNIVFLSDEDEYSAGGYSLAEYNQTSGANFLMNSGATSLRDLYNSGDMNKYYDLAECNAANQDTFDQAIGHSLACVYEKDGKYYTLSSAIYKKQWNALDQVFQPEADGPIYNLDKWEPIGELGAKAFVATQFDSFIAHAITIQTTTVLEDGTVGGADVSCYQEQLQQASAWFGTHYIGAANATGGTNGSICSATYDDQLSLIGERAIELKGSYQLKCSNPLELSIIMENANGKIAATADDYMLNGDKLTLSEESLRMNSVVSIDLAYKCAE
ncbi:hypothetical protein N9W41_01055 [bacterium]|nr:hypothetical protein [bacterium]